VGRIAREPRWRLATGGYLGHMWELYAAWTWLPAFIAASVVARDPAAGRRGQSGASAVAFAALAVGGLGLRVGRPRRRPARARLAGHAGDGGERPLRARHRPRVRRELWVLAPLALVWGFFVIADSAQFSVLVTESVPPHAVGTALTLQTSLGFLLTSVSIQLVPRLAGAVGWRGPSRCSPWGRRSGSRASGG
jgi:hypothetical protein